MKFDYEQLGFGSKVGLENGCVFYTYFCLEGRLSTTYWWSYYLFCFVWIEIENFQFWVVVRIFWWIVCFINVIYFVLQGCAKKCVMYINKFGCFQVFDYIVFYRWSTRCQCYLELVFNVWLTTCLDIFNLSCSRCWRMGYMLFLLFLLWWL